MKIKTANLTGPALDWAVAKCEGWDKYLENDLPVRYADADGQDIAWGPSTDWPQGGPIIEREGVRLHHSHNGAWWAGPESDPHRPVSGPTPLIAAMRCFVASKLGEEVDVPDVLCA
jgi:hypothetical protein